MRTARTDPADAPAGYQRWAVGNGAWLLLPTGAVDTMLVERQAQARTAVLGSERTPEPRQVDKPKALSWAERWGEAPLPGRLRVVLQHEAIVDGTLLEQRLTRSADSDVTRRSKDILDRLAAEGPDRSIARPPNWREGLQELVREMPHFAEPVRLLSNALALGEASACPTRIPPMLLLGPPGVGKTHFSQAVAALLGTSHASLAFDQPGAGTGLRGSDKYWGNSHYGLLFELLCLGEHANPVVLLDEIDKAAVESSNHGSINPLGQLHGALEPVTARRLSDVSLDLEFDASLVTYIATANSLRGIEPSVLSRFEIFSIALPEPREAVETARRLANSVLARLGLDERLRFDPKGYYVLAHLSPRLMLRTVEKSAAAAVAEKRSEVSEADLWAELGMDGESELH
jgi:hypothetical protein